MCDARRDALGLRAPVIRPPLWTRSGPASVAGPPHSLPLAVAMPDDGAVTLESCLGEHRPSVAKNRLPKKCPTTSARASPPSVRTARPHQSVPTLLFDAPRTHRAHARQRARRASFRLHKRSPPTTKRLAARLHRDLSDGPARHSHALRLAAWKGPRTRLVGTPVLLRLTDRRLPRPWLGAGRYEGFVTYSVTPNTFALRKVPQNRERVPSYNARAFSSIG